MMPSFVLLRFIEVGAIVVAIGAVLLVGAGIVQSAQPPYPQSNVVTQISWEPADGIERAAEGGDNWPITWAADDDLYAAYGDGWGFEPQLDTKLSLGFAKVTGSAENWSGSNIRSPSGEQTGSGASGKKASSLLSVEGTLYMWVRNANQDGTGCQLAWSQDGSSSWTYSDWTFDDFGYCVFLNYGRDYENARDGFVYMYSPNGSSAYQPADDMILTRVPKSAIVDRSQYEFFSGLDQASEPTWSSDLSSRASVFAHPNNCLRSGISYNEGVDRYFWWQQIAENGVDTRFSGGFAIYDAPEPWGPWTTSYFTESWDVGPGDAASFPTKWISPDGLTMYLVFAGDDHFSVREANLTVRGESSVPKPPVLEDQ